MASEVKGDDLMNKVVLVTGGAHRVGKAIALEFARYGASVAIHFNSNEDSARETQSQITKAFGVKCEIFKADQSKFEEIDCLFKAVEEEFGVLDILVNSANYFYQKPFMEITPEDWSKVMAINVNGPFFMCQNAAKLMKTKGIEGVIINIVDNSAQQAWPAFSAHGVAKAALLNLSKTLSRALAPSIRVNAVAPGPVMKDPHRSDGNWKAIGKSLPLQRTGSGEDVARAVVFLARENFITGAFLQVDGGESLITPKWTPA